MRNILAVLAVVVGWASEAGAQVCTGTPISRGAWGIGVGASAGEDFTDYGLGVSASVVDDFFASVSYSRTQFDLPASDGNHLGGSLALQIATGNASICPSVSLHRSWSTYDAYGRDIVSGFSVQTADEVHASTVGLPLGVSVGAPFGSLDRAYFLPSISAGILFSRTTWDLFRTPINNRGQQIAQAYREEFHESETFGYGGAGITFGYRMVFFSGGLSMTTAEGAEPVASLGLGLIF
jgi:hypothetical protein